MNAIRTIGHSLHAIDRFFERVRRRLMPLERPIHTPSNALRGIVPSRVEIRSAGVTV